MERLGEHGEHCVGNERHFRRLRVQEVGISKILYSMSFIFFQISDFVFVIFYVLYIFFKSLILFFPFFQEAKIEQDGCGEQRIYPPRTTQGSSDECREKEEIQIHI